MKPATVCFHQSSFSPSPSSVDQQDTTNQTGSTGRLCQGPNCSPPAPLSSRQRLYHSLRCRLDAKNHRRNLSEVARAKNAAAVQRHRERVREADPMRRYLQDATREIIRAYRNAGKPIRRAEAMRVLRIIERELVEPHLIRQRVRALLRRTKVRP